jgi:hypothetical protein
MLFAILAILAGGLFAGAAVYVSLVEHPARLSCGTGLAVLQFRPSYRRGAVMQASLAGVGLLLGVGGWFDTGHRPLLWGGLLLGSVIPYTLLVILPTNRRLLDPSLDPESSEAATLLERWGRLHSVRAVIGTLAFLVLLHGAGHG